MPQRMRISRAGIELIKSFEGFTPRTTRIGENRWVIGYGHVRSDKDQYRVSRDEAEQILKEYDLPPYEQLVLENTYTPLHQGAFDALVSFAFNIGKDAFLASDVLSLLNTGEILAAADAMGAWRRAKIKGRTIVVDALVRRRAAEKALFLSDPAGPAPAPSAIIRPQIDPSAHMQINRNRSVVVESTEENDVAGVLPYQPDEERRLKSDTVISAPRPMERLTRRFDQMLSENEEVVSARPTEAATPTIVDPSVGPTPEEITAAISELVNGAAAVEEPSFSEDLPGFDLDEIVRSNDDELEPYPIDVSDADEAQNSERFARTLGDEDEILELPEIDEPLVIDDLEPVEISEDDIQRAMKTNRELEGNFQAEHVRNWGPFAFIAMIGAGLFTWGMFLLQGKGIVASQAFLSFELLLIISGAILFATMAYYFVREFTKQDDD